MRLVKVTLKLGAAYDTILGIAVLFAHQWIYSFWGIEPANHAAYIQLPALFVIILGLMQAIAAVEPTKKLDLVLCILLMKLSYCAVVFGHWALGSIPMRWVSFAFCDLAFAFVFASFLVTQRKSYGLH